MSNRQRHIVVIGAGVTGLTSAKFLAEAGYLVTIVAAWVPGELSIEYTSPWAGAHWSTFATPDQPHLCDWDVQTYKYWVDLLEREEKNDTSKPIAQPGIKLQDSYILWDKEPDEELWWSPHVQSFQHVSLHTGPIAKINSRLPHSDPKIQWAVGYREFCIDSPRYLRWLESECASLGVKLIKAKLPAEQNGLAKAAAKAEGIAQRNGRPETDLFVNATGLAAGKLCSDPAVYPVRGQTVLVKGETVASYSKRGERNAYCIRRPGSGTSILGGTRDKGNWSEKPDPEITKTILERNKVLAPGLLTGPGGEFEVISVQCGLRPGRDGGPRVEREVLEGRKFVHSYGHDGAGYQASVGCARAVTKLVGESLADDGIVARL